MTSGGRLQQQQQQQQPTPPGPPRLTSASGRHLASPQSVGGRAGPSHKGKDKDPVPDRARDRARLSQQLANGCFRCTVCGYTTIKRYHMNRHLRKHSGELFHCSLCPQKFYEKCMLTSHVLRHYRVAAQSSVEGGFSTQDNWLHSNPTTVPRQL